MKSDVRRLRKLGLDINDFKIFDNVHELIKVPPKFVIAKTTSDSILNIDGRQMRLPNGEAIIMPLNFYLQTRRGKKRVLQLKPHKKNFKDIFKRYRGQSLNNKTLLIIRLGGIGDHLFSQPICKYLKKKYPTCKIIYACKEQYRSTFDAWPDGLVDRTIPM